MYPGKKKKPFEERKASRCSIVVRLRTDGSVEVQHFERRRSYRRMNGRVRRISLGAKTYASLADWLATASKGQLAWDLTYRGFVPHRRPLGCE